MPEQFISFEEALQELQMQEGELRGLVSQGKLRAFRDENTLKFRRADVEALRAEMGTAATQPEAPAPESDAGVQPVEEEPVDLLADDILDYDDTSETLVGDVEEGETGETEIAIEDAGLEPAAEGEGPTESSTTVPTIELTPTDSETEETAVPSLELSEEEEAGTDSETEVPTMVLGLDEYDDTQVATEEVPTEEVGTEEVFIDESELADSSAPTAELEAPEEEPYVAPEEVEEPEEGVGRLSAGSSGFGSGTGELVRREQPSALFTVTTAVAAAVLLIPGSIFFYCIVSNQVPKWGILQSLMTFVLQQFGIEYPPSMG